MMEQQSSTTKLAASPYSDLEAKIQKERLLKILDDTIVKTELSLCLPALIKNDSKLLRPWFKDEQIDYIEEACKDYKTYQSLLCNVTTKISYSSMRSTSVKTGELIEEEVTDDYRTYGDLCKVINLLYDHSELRNLSTENMLSDGALAFVNSLKQLRTCIIERLNTSPEEELKKNDELSELYKQNERDKEEIMKLKAKLNKQLAESEQKIELKKLEIEKEQEKIENVQKRCRENIRKKREEAEKKINWDMKNSEFRLEELQNAYKTAQFQKETQLKEHLASEKDLRTKRFKVESQLVAMLQKYDTDIGDRQAQLEEMTAAFEEEKEQMIKLQECFDQQEIEYQSLMFEKEMYEMKLWEAKLYEIQCKIAARKIQRFYRSYLAMCKAKGKKGKGKGKGKKKK